MNARALNRVETKDPPQVASVWDNHSPIIFGAGRKSRASHLTDAHHQFYWRIDIPGASHAKGEPVERDTTDTPDTDLYHSVQ